MPDLGLPDRLQGFRAMSVIVQPTFTEGLLCGGHCARCLEQAVKDAALCLEKFAAWWGGDQKTGECGGSGEPLLIPSCILSLRTRRERKAARGEEWPSRVRARGLPSSRKQAVRGKGSI